MNPELIQGRGFGVVSQFEFRVSAHVRRPYRCAGCPKADTDAVSLCLHMSASKLPGNSTAEIVNILQTRSTLLRKQDVHQAWHAFLDAKPCIRAAQSGADPTWRH